MDGAIQRAAGPELLAACRSLGGCATGSSKITPGFRLPARYIIHAVGPVYQSGALGEPGLLASCYRTSLTLAAEHACRTIAFPAISCGVYGYPLDEAAAIAVREVRAFANAKPDLVDEVLFVCFGPEASAAYRNALAAP